MRTVIHQELLQTTKSAFTALFVLFSLALSFEQAHAFQGRMENVSIGQCGKKACISVSATSADVSWFSTNMNLQKAQLSVQQIKGSKQVYNADDIYFDNAGQRIYLHGVAELKNGEAFYDLRSEQFTVFSN